MASQNQTLFCHAVSQVFNSWTALQLAVEHNFGGADSRAKAEWMAYAIETWFKENDGIEPYEVEDFLEDVLNAEFDLKVEDASVPEISGMICSLFRLCQENRVDEIQQRLATLPKASLQNCQKVEETNDDFDSVEEVVPENTQSTSSHHNSTTSTSSHHNSTASTSSHQNSTPSSSETASRPGNSENMDVSDEGMEEDGWQVMRRGRKK